MNMFGVVVTVAVLVAIAVLILLFERKRAKEIERDLSSGQDPPDRRSHGESG